MDTKPVKVLIIDNDEDVRYTIAEICRYCGYEPIQAPDGQTGLALAEAHRPRLALVDYHMPGWDGLTTVRKLRELPLTLGIIVMTVDGRQELAERFLAAGASDFAVKPLKAPDLMARMKLHLRLLDMEGSETAAPEKDTALDKGMSAPTLKLVAEALARQDAPVLLEDLAAELGLAYQTVHRYLQYLLEQGRAEAIPRHGALGRPKNAYKIRVF